MMNTKALYLSTFLILLLSLFFLLGCTKLTSEAEQYSQVLDGGRNYDTETTSLGWFDAELTDIRTGQTFKIRDFKGKPILLESFAVWCPVCTRQQKNIQKLHEEGGDSFVSVSLDTDPNEDAAMVKEAVEERGFDWYFAVSPAEVTRALIAQFGISIVDAPAAPIIMVCENQSARLLKHGLKSVQELKEEIAKGC